MSTTVVFAVPGKLDQLTGGYLFDRRVVESFRDRDSAIRVAELPGAFPLVDLVAINAAKDLVSSLKQEEVLVIDGLALPAFASLLPLKQGGRSIGFIHHPLFLETNLMKDLDRYFSDLESALWSSLDGIICASPSTARTVISAGICHKKVLVASPGVDLPTLPQQRYLKGTHGVKALRLLCVATVTARKGHIFLIQALSQLRHKPWTLDCYGCLDRDPDSVKMVRRSITQYGLADRISLHGEISPEQLSSAWLQADVFVLPSLHEGYGMVLTEAIAHGLPVVSTLAGAIPETLPQSASCLVEPSNSLALANVLSELMDDSDKLERLRMAALHERTSLVPWPEAIERWHQALSDCITYEKASQ